LSARDVGGGDGRSGAFQRRRQDVTGAAPGRQIRSECLIMPDRCPGRPTARRLPARGVVALFPEKRQASSRLPGAGESPGASRKQGPWSQFWSHSRAFKDVRGSRTSRHAQVTDCTDPVRTGTHRLGKRVWLHAGCLSASLVVEAHRRTRMSENLAHDTRPLGRDLASIARVDKWPGTL
jgi:hypothetical protein